jgi:ABC-type nitrate/sulfonate/bicarbonate transport system permease component
MDAYGKAPFIVYDYFPVEHDADMWMVSCAQVMFTIYANSYSKVTEIRNLLEDMFRRQDVSAAELNATLTLPSSFHFTGTGLVSGSDTEPRTELGGRLASEMIIEVHYIRQLSSSTGRYA